MKAAKNIVNPKLTTHGSFQTDHLKVQHNSRSEPGTNACGMNDVKPKPLSNPGCNRQLTHSLGQGRGSMWELGGAGSQRLRGGGRAEALLFQTTSWHHVGSCARPWGEASAQRASQCHPTGYLPMRSCRWAVTSRAPGCTLVMSPHLLKHSEPGISLLGWQHHETGQEKLNGWGWSHRTGWLSPNVGNSSNYQTKLSREYRLLSHGTVSQTEVTVRLTVSLV